MPGVRLSGEEVEGYLGKKIVDGTRAMHEVQDGKGGYVAMLEVMHLLHCLVSLLLPGPPIRVFIWTSLVGVAICVLGPAC